MVNGYEIAIMEWKKCINDGIGEATKKICALIDESSDSSSLITGNCVSAYNGVDGPRKKEKISALKIIDIS